MKKTLVIGASENPDRYSNMAIRLLRQYHHPVVAVGNKKGKVGDVEIEKDQLPFNDIDTVTLYVGPQNQAAVYQYVLSLHPKRVIFNPGTENPDFEMQLEKAGIETEEACTLVLLRTGAY